MPPNKKDDFNLDDINSDEPDKLLENLNNQTPIELPSFETDLAYLLDDIQNTQLPETFFSDDEAFQKLLEDISVSESESNSIDWSEPNFSALLEDTEEFDLSSIEESLEEEPIPEPDPNLTAKDVAAWMLKQVETKGVFYQQDAAWHIRRYFGECFIGLNKNSNPAISKKVLKEFRLISLKTVVWNRRELYWRLRQPSDPSKSRRVDD
ncbi:hypothetical protein H6F50_08520 [Coleofasciculus sp. FACHB-712]|uniref:DUF6953 family protein n=1 Tax=Coleofasciculus sp. FACHB-712 TaxID=2692789 RepID=UPI0016864F75|nr:hypothetical protein [Coleofasciculus sp. FACHB-712]MBD1942399.1 hypothetical protein [Coleofasciculus sp. FACHB-712]